MRGVAVGQFFSKRLACVVVTLTAALSVVAIPAGAQASTDAKGGNKGDVWVDNVGQPPGPGHEMDPHLACADINLWGNNLATSSGTYTIDGWPPSGSMEQDYPASGPGNWKYDTSAGGDQIMDVINVGKLIANAVANGDAVHNKQGFHFKLQFVQLPQKHKTFWVNCPATPPPPPPPKQTPFVLQNLDSCRQAIGGGTFELKDSGGNVIQTQSAPAAAPVTVSHASGCPIQGSSCVAFSTGCVTFTLDIPASGTSTFTIVQTVAASGYLTCNGGSACQSETMTITLDSSGGIKATTAQVLPDGTVQTDPTNDPNTGAAFWVGTPADPALFYDEKLGNASCDGDNDLDDHNSGSPSSHCDNDADKI